MATPKRMSDKGIEFLVHFEGEQLRAYRDPVGVWTIGVGHTGPVDGRRITAGMTISRAKSRELLRLDLRRFENAVVKHVPHRWRRIPRRFDALVSLAFNLGEEVLTARPPLESLGRALRAEKVTKANADRIAAAIKLYDKAGGRRLPGLTRRRRAEARLFATPSADYSTD